MKLSHETYEYLLVREYQKRMLKQLCDHRAARGLKQPSVVGTVVCTRPDEEAVQPANQCA